MFAEYFVAAARHLESVGFKPDIRIGNPVSSEQLDETERMIGRAIPTELRAYFLEMSDDYCFSPDGKQFGFEIGCYGDYEFKVAGFSERLREEAPLEANRNHTAEEVGQELVRREKWFPFYNFGGGGYMFCLDLNESPPPVRYYERCYWPRNSTDHWNLKMADSFHDFIRQWSRYCFADANGVSLINVAMKARGVFDWSPSRFNPIFDRGTTDI